MRLAQLARKLAVRPAEITGYLAAQGISVSEGSNVRMEEIHVRIAIMHFAPSELESILDISTENDEDAASSETPEAVDTPVMTLTQPAIQEEISQPEEEIVFEPRNEEVKPEVIKAPKVELPGLKVVGKIELPEPKKKEPESEAVKDEPAEESTSPSETRQKRKQSREKRKPDHPRRSSVALQREREARAAEKKKKEEERREKERRTQHYLKKVKPSVPTKRASLFSEEVVEMTDEVGSEPPKTLWGKFMRWLRRE